MKTYKFRVALPDSKGICIATHNTTMPQAKKKVINHYKAQGIEVAVSLDKGTQEPVSII